MNTSPTTALTDWSHHTASIGALASQHEVYVRQLQKPRALGGERGAGACMLPAWRALAARVEGGAMPHAGHWIADEQPDALAARLAAFFDRVEAGGSTP